MANWTNKKSLAIAAAGSLALTGLSVAPAQAAVSFVTVPIEGTNTNAILGSEFVLQTTVADAGTGTDVKYMVTGVTSVSDIEADAEDVASIASLTADATIDDGASDSIVEQLDGSEPIIIDPSDTVDTANPYMLLAVGLVEAEVEDKTTITVTPFTDGNDDGVYDSDLAEVMGDAISITFHPTDEVTVTASQVVDVNGNTVSVNAAINEVNNGSIRARSSLQQLLTYDIVVGAEDNNNNDFGAAEYDATDDRFESTALNLTSISSDSRIVSTVYVGEETDAATVVRTNLAGTDANSYEASTAIADDKDGSETIRIRQTNPYFLHDTAGNTDDVLREGDGNLTASIVVVDDTSPNPLPVEGETVTWTIAEADNDSWDSGVSVTSGGSTLSNDDSSDTEDIEVTSVTNSDGEAFVTFNYSGLDAGNQIVLTADVVNSGIAAPTRTLEAITPAEYEVYVTNVDTAASFVVDESESYTVNLSLRDEFGFAPENTARVELAVNYSAGSLRDEQEFVVFDSNGNGSFTATAPAVSSDDAATLGLLDIPANDGSTTDDNLDIQDSDGDYGNDYHDVSLSGQTAMTVANGGVEPAVEIEFVATESHDDETALAIADHTLYSVDTRLAGGDEFGALTALDTVSPSTTGFGGTPETTGNDYQNEATALVTDQFGLPVAGASVTFASSGVEFTDKTGEIQSVGSITVYTDSNGKALVGFLSNTAGDSEITATTGSLSDTLDINVDSPSGEGDLASWSVSPSSTTVDPGSTLNFVATALDKYGNALDLSGGDGLTVEYDGPGIVIPNAYSGIVKTNSDGQVKLAIAFGSNDSGSHSITVSGDLDTTSKTDDVAATYSFTIGEGTFTGTYGDVYAWTVDQGDGTAKVYVKFPTIGEKVRIGHQTGGSGSYETIYVKTTSSETMDGLRQVAGVGTYVVRTIDLESGTNRIRVDVGDDRLVQVRYNE